MKKDKMKKKMMGYKAGGLQMVEKDGKKVPFYAADGKGKMMMGGKVMGYKEGKTVKKKPLFRKLSEKERLEKSGLPVTVRDSKTKETNKRKTAKMGQANRASGGAERKEDTLVGKAINRGMLGVAAMADIVRAASGTKKGAGPSSYMGPSIRAGVKAAKIKKERAGKMAGGMMKKKMMGGGKVMGYKKGGMPRGCGVATRQRPAKMIVMKGS